MRLGFVLSHVDFEFSILEPMSGVTTALIPAFSPQEKEKRSLRLDSNQRSNPQWSHMNIKAGYREASPWGRGQSEGDVRLSASNQSGSLITPAAPQGPTS